jgi:predicted PurR-regulated permease PerM
MFPLSALLPVLFVVTLMLLLRHFLGSLAWACLLAVITWPLHEKLLRRGWSPVGSAATLLGALLLSFSGPSVFLFNTLSNEVSTVERLLGQLNQTGVPAPEWMANLPLVAKPVLAWWQEHLAVPGGLNTLLRTTAGDLVPHLTSTLGTLGPTVLANALYLFLAMLTLFVLYVQGPAVVKYVDRAGLRIVPHYYAVLRRLFPLSVRGTALGLCSVALLEGIVLGFAYAIAGAPAPVLLGVVTVSGRQVRAAQADRAPGRVAIPGRAVRPAGRCIDHGRARPFHRPVHDGGIVLVAAGRPGRRDGHYRENRRQGRHPGVAQLDVLPALKDLSLPTLFAK